MLEKCWNILLILSYSNKLLFQVTVVFLAKTVHAGVDPFVSDAKLERIGLVYTREASSIRSSLGLLSVLVWVG